MKSTLTSHVLAASLVARPIYKGGPGTRAKKASQADHLNGLLASYVEATDDISSSHAHLIFAGKRIIPVSVVMYYSDGTLMCPKELYEDIETYLDAPSISHAAKRDLLDNLYTILDIIPKRDRRNIKAAVEACTANKTCMLLTMLLYYAWCIDLAQYTYLTA